MEIHLHFMIIICNLLAGVDGHLFHSSQLVCSEHIKRLYVLQTHTPNNLCVHTADIT